MPQLLGVSKASITISQLVVNQLSIFMQNVARERDSTHSPDTGHSAIAQILAQMVSQPDSDASHGLSALKGSSSLGNCGSPQSDSHRSLSPLSSAA